MPKDDPNRQMRSQLVAGLAQGQAPPPEEAPPNPFANAGVQNDSPLVSGQPQALAESEEQLPVEEAPEVVNEEPQSPDSLPEPEVEEGVPAVNAPFVPPTAKLTAPPKPPLKPLTRKDQFTCMACGAPHKFRSQLLKHAQQKHPERIQAIMAPYPDTPTLP